MLKISFLALVITLTSSSQQSPPSWYNDASTGFDMIRTSLQSTKKTLETVNLQMMLQHFYHDERVRSEGFSGVKSLRSYEGGNENYYTGSHNNKHSFGSIHDHSNQRDTLGLGEMDVVLNGVEFRTRHNDYRMRMPSSSSDGLFDTDPIPFPKVPPSVLQKNTVEEQTEEMRLWFKAWRDQDPSVRNYTEYFKPVLCYLEGAWTSVNDNIEQAYTSQIHKHDAHTWQNLHDITRYMSDVGLSQRQQNIPFLPTRVDHVEGSTANTSQWQYRILCHPLEGDLPLNRFHLTDDMAAMMADTDLHNVDELLHSRHARFTLNTKDQDEQFEGEVQHELIDKLMEQVPGMDNYQGFIAGKGLDGDDIYEMDGVTEKNLARYHRMFRLGGKDASGLQNVARGFSDRYMFAARTTQDRVADASYTSCKPWNHNDCYSRSEKWSYAIPLEIVYLTPLLSWNPLGLEYKGEFGDGGTGDSATAGGRWGSCTDQSRALLGTNSFMYYHTPPEFYDDTYEHEIDTADTGRWPACAMNPSGQSIKVRSSGTRIITPSIRGVGQMRLRYPIMPVHGEGSTVWKELNALRNCVLYKHFAYLKYDQTIENIHPVYLEMTYVEGEDRHTHLIKLVSAEYAQIKGGHQLIKTTQQSGHDVHTHKLEIRWDNNRRVFFAHRCDDLYKCNHGRDLHVVTLGDDLDMTNLF